MIRVLIADDQALVRGGFHMILEASKRKRTSRSSARPATDATPSPRPASSTPTSS
jgi:DNA-binding NarL/FixJ family response regulator